VDQSAPDSLQKADSLRHNDSLLISILLPKPLLWIAIFWSNLLLAYTASLVTGSGLGTATHQNNLQLNLALPLLILYLGPAQACSSPALGTQALLRLNLVLLRLALDKILVS
jgi:hypothetical protein